MAIATSYGAFIAGEWVHGEGGKRDRGALAVRRLAARQRDARVGGAGRRRGGGGKAAFPAWRRTSVVDRVELCRRAYDLCMERNEEIAQIIAREVGKTIREAREEMEEFTVDHFRRAAEDMLRHAGQVLPSTQEREGAQADHRGAGAGRRGRRGLAVELPRRHRRHPDRLRARGSAAPSVWKPSEYAPLCAELFVQLLHDAGFPAGTVNLVHGRGDVGASSCAIRAWPRSSSPARSRPASRSRATPASRTACSSSAATARRSCWPTPTSSAPPTPRSSAASTSPGSAARPRSASSCTASVNDRFVGAAGLARTRDLQVGDPAGRGHRHGPGLHAGGAGAHAGAHRRRGREGRHASCSAAATTGQFHEPTVIDGVTSAMRIAQEETFGPVAPIMTFDTLDEAIEIAERDRVRPHRGGLHALAARRLARGRGARATARCTSTRPRTTGTRWRRSAARRSPAPAASCAGWIFDAMTETKQITWELG